MVTFKNYGHMKSNRLFAAVLAAIAFAGCVKENQPADQVNPDTDAPKGELVTLDFTASLDPDTKTTFGPMTEENTLPVVWEEKDVLAVFVGDKAYSDIAITIDEESAKKAHFTAQIDTPAEGDGMMVFYPSQGAAVAEGGIQFTLDAEQLAAGNGLPKRKGSYQPLAAAVADAGDAQAVVAAGGASLNFRNVFAAVRFTFPANDIMKISFKGNDNEDVAGTYVVAADGSIAGVSEGKKEVTLVTSDNMPFKAEYDGTALAYQLLVAPQTFEKGFTLTMTTSDGLVYEKTTSKELVLKRSDIVSLGQIKVTGITASRTVWSKFNKSWYSEFSSKSTDIRNIAMDDNYVYMVHAGGAGVHAVNLMDGSFVKSLSTAGIANGTHLTSDANVIDGEDGARLLVCNLASGKGGILKLYSYDSLDADPAVLLTYNLPEAYRLGDHFTVEGTWENGRLLFYDYNQTGKVAIFAITDGKVSSSPEFMTLATKPGGNIGAMYKYPFNDSEYMYGGAGGRMDVFSVSGLNATRTLDVTDGGTFSNDIHGISFFVVGGKKYMAHVGLYDSRTSGRIKVAELKGATLAASMSGITHPWNFYLAGDDDAAIGASNGNAAGDAAFRVIGGKVYLAGNVPGSGIRVVELK